MKRPPWIAVILDENTSGDGSRYEISKGCFMGVRDAGGIPFGVPYLPEIINIVVEEFDGLLCTGGRYAYPAEWYVGRQVSNAPFSERFAIEQAIIQSFIGRDKPVLGICAGMQLLAGVKGCRLWSSVREAVPNAIEHDKRGSLHRVSIAPETRLAGLVGQSDLLVNTSHFEAIGELSPSVVVSARSDDGVIEAIEVPSHSFALGLQWHQELFAGNDHPGNGIFRGLVDACRASPER